ncbi:MAG TPA: hypothetical protein VKZ99_04310 [Gammaproteobacteria bacterium]|nr:hypothetical protein [Gammaproteobacteria bacterium]
MKKNRLYVLIAALGLSCMGSAMADELGTGKDRDIPDAEPPVVTVAMEWLQSLLQEWF